MSTIDTIVLYTQTCTTNKGTDKNADCELQFTSEKGFPAIFIIGMILNIYTDSITVQ